MIDEKMFQRMRIPPKYWDADITKVGDPQNKYIIRYVRGLFDALDKGWGLLMWGEYSSGKTATSCAIMKAVSVIKKTALFVTANDIPKYLIEKTIFDSQESMEERMISADLLVIDELILHSVDDSTFRDTCLETILRRRLGAKKSTIFTSNLSVEVIKDRFPAFSSVMTEAIFPIQFFGAFREEKSQQIAKFLLEEDNE
tara:strand:- start:1062 stop:1658 length:597 start_codon:yes stop_codon:yes gene_type:complete